MVDVALLDDGTCTDHHRATDARVADRRTGFDHDTSLDLRASIDVTVVAWFEHFEHEPITFEERVFLPSVDPPAFQHLVVDDLALLDDPLDRIGDLEFATWRRL